MGEAVKLPGTGPAQLDGRETKGLQEAFRARSTRSAWVGYAVPQDAQAGALAFLFTEAGHGGPLALFRTQAGGYGVTTADGKVVWTGKSLEDVPAAFQVKF